MARVDRWKPAVDSPAAAAEMLIHLRVPLLHGPDSGVYMTLSDAWPHLDAAERRTLMHGVILALPEVDVRTRDELLTFARVEATADHAALFEAVIEPWPAWADEPDYAASQGWPSGRPAGAKLAMLLLRLFPGLDGPWFSRLARHAERYGADAAVLRCHLEAGACEQALVYLRGMLVRGCSDVAPALCARVFARSASQGKAERLRLLEVNRLMAGSSKATRCAWEYSLSHALHDAPQLWAACQRVLSSEPALGGD